MPTILTGPELTAAALGLVANFNPSRIPRSELTELLTAFLQPLTSEHLRDESVDKLVEAANDYQEAMEYANDPMEVMDEKGGSWARHAQKSLRRVQVIAEAIADGGRP